MYDIIRYIISCIFFVCLIIVTKNFKAIRKPVQYVISIGLTVLLHIALTFMPFENLFITFDSPKAAYEYYAFEKSNIELIVEGEGCDLIIDRKKACSYAHLIIPKTADGWKIGIGKDTKTILNRFLNGISINVFQYKNTSDYFITVFDTNGGESSVSDEHGTKFFPLESYNEFLGEKYVVYFAHITNLNSQSSVIVNGNKIVLGDQ